MKRSIILTGLGCILAAVTLHAEQTRLSLVTKRYVLNEHVSERVLAILDATNNTPMSLEELDDDSDCLCDQTPSTNQWLSFFSSMGVEAVPGFSASYADDLHALEVVCTSNGIATIDRIFAFAQATRNGINVQIDALLILFSKDEIETLSRKGSLTPEALLALYKSGGGTLYAAPSVLTECGVPARASTCREFVYPTEFRLVPLPTDADTNSVSTIIAGVVEPSQFNMREVGVVLDVDPALNLAGELTTSLSIHVVTEPEWKDYGDLVQRTDGKPTGAKLEEPFFSTFSCELDLAGCSDTFTLASGGGTAIGETGKVFYAFARCQMAKESNDVPHAGR